MKNLDSKTYNIQNTYEKKKMFGLCDDNATVSL